MISFAIFKILRDKYVNVLNMTFIKYSFVYTHTMLGENKLSVFRRF